MFTDALRMDVDHYAILIVGIPSWNKLPAASALLGICKIGGLNVCGHDIFSWLLAC
tara:strand:- start:316 stop:483 length:168 start_codon:yes stop_codon:yes gene_type:complete